MACPVESPVPLFGTQIRDTADGDDRALRFERSVLRDFGDVTDTKWEFGRRRLLRRNPSVVVVLSSLAPRPIGRPETCRCMIGLGIVALRIPEAAGPRATVAALSPIQ
jgi:hypothetical protein